MIGRKLLAALCIVGVVAGIATACDEPGKDYRAPRFDVNLALQEDGTLLVTETVDFAFEGGPFTYVYRDLALTETDGIDVLEASVDGQPWPFGTESGQVEVETGDSVLVTWHLPPTTDAARSFGLTYRVDGVIRPLDTDTLIWRAIPEEHDYEIDSSQIALSYPAAAQLVGTPAVDGAAASLSAEGGRVVIRTADIDDDEDLVVRAHFTPASFDVAAPRWWIEEERRGRQLGQAAPYAVGAGFLTTVLALLGLLTFWRRNARPKTLAATASHQVTPPDDSSPAAAARLVGLGPAALAAIFDLAQQGILRIDEAPKRWGRGFVVRDMASGRATRSYEQTLLHNLFATRTGSVDSLPMEKLRTKLASSQKEFQQQLDQELVDFGLLDPARRARRQRLILLATIALLAGGVLFFMGLIALISSAGRGDGAAPSWLAVMTGVGAGLFLASLAAYIAAAAFSIWTREGEERVQAWKSFADYLKDVTRGRETLLDDSLFDQYLPYAAGFGLARGWARQYQEASGAPVPEWFMPLQAGSEGGEAFVALMAASSASSSGGAGAGGAGASGGGGSGAG